MIVNISGVTHIGGIFTGDLYWFRLHLAAERRA